MLENLSNEDLTESYKNIILKTNAKFKEFYAIRRDLQRLSRIRNAIRDEIDAREIEQRNAIDLERQFRR